jgi:hypothetical protein
MTGCISGDRFVSGYTSYSQLDASCSGGSEGSRKLGVGSCDLSQNQSISGAWISPQGKSCVWITGRSQTKPRALTTTRSIPICQHTSFPFHPRAIPKMSTFRVLRSLTASTSRTVSARALSRSVHPTQLGSRLASRAVVPASRWFSASARVMGDGSSMPRQSLVVCLTNLCIQRTWLCPKSWPRSSSMSRRLSLRPKSLSS